MMINKDNPIPLYLQLAKGIEKEILDGNLKDGDKLPSEQVLMKKYTLARMTVRSAIMELQNKGLVKKKQGFGTFVTREQNLSNVFSPFISLSFNAKSLGLSEENKLIEEKIALASTLFELQEGEDKLCKIVTRVRYLASVRAALEYDAIDLEIAKDLKKEDEKTSLTKYLLTKTNIKMGRFDQKVIIRKANSEEQKYLKLTAEDEVLAMDRFLYEKDTPSPCFFVRFIINAKLIAGEMEKKLFL
ncbi:MAG: GntR family transcriptional regulator [Spirochaetales bacterium]|nr:GntR family transcriptional regulator [Spirochaetales bacterium]